MSTELDDMTAQERKDHPIFTGVLKYFPNALLEIAHVSKVGNDQHNPGEPLHWAMEKSTDEGDALVRHQLKAGTRDKDGERHSAKVAWRALAQLEREILAERDGLMGQTAKDQRTYPGDGFPGKGPFQVVGDTTVAYNPEKGEWLDGRTGQPLDALKQSILNGKHSLSDSMMGNAGLRGAAAQAQEATKSLSKGIRITDDLKSEFVRDNSNPMTYRP